MLDQLIPYLGNKYNNEEINKIIYKNEKLKKTDFLLKNMWIKII